MTPKEKAMDIFNKMCNSVDELLPLDVKVCALIAVDFIWQSLEHERIFEMWDYWKEVKQEIEKL